MEDKPLYLQIEDKLRKNITDGHWSIGECIPGEPVLSKQFGVSRVTLRHAISDLVGEGLLVREHGRGTFVAKPPACEPSHDQQRISTSFTDICRAQGHVPSARLISAALETECPDEIATFLHLGSAPAFKLFRVRSSDDRPVLIEVNYFRPSFAFLTEHDLSQSIYEILRRNGVVPGEHSRHIGIVYADATDAELLGVAEGSALLYNRAFVRDSDGKPLHVADQHAIADDPKLYQFYA